jgi:HAD superfamily hydrolase (TIGR01484 family)
MDVNKKIFVSDYDQTFYLNDEDIEKNKIAINEFRKKGNIFVIATGRSYFDFQNKVDEYNLNYDYVIINHGATILDKNNNILINFPKNEIIPHIKNDLQLEKSIKGFCCSELESRVDFNHKSLTKINVRYNSKEEAMKINDNINAKYFEFVNSYYVTINSLEIISNKTNKSKAIDLLINKLKLSKENAYTIGDGYSDIEMVKNFNGYAMKKSVDELKKVAKKEYDSVSELINEIM